MFAFDFVAVLSAAFAAAPAAVQQLLQALRQV
jgi:hypothetical protein